MSKTSEKQLRLSRLIRLGDVVRVVLEDHCDCTHESLDGPELTFEAFGRVVQVNDRSVVLQTWGNLPRDGKVEVDSDTELYRILLADVVSVRRMR